MAVISANVHAQGDIKNNIKFFADVLVNASDAENREYASVELNGLMDKWLQSDQSFSDELKDVPWISVKYDQAKNFRILTWQLKGKNDVFSHFGYIQHKDGRLEQLNAGSTPNADTQYEILGADNWIGALYYGVETVGNEFLLFGFHGGNGKEYTKLVDVLSFDKNGKAVFGKELFRFDQGNTRPDLHSRIFVSYTPTAVVSCKYDVDTKMIIHDYTSEKMLGLEGTAIGKVPDGTYVAFEYKDGIWQRIDKLENTPIDLKSPDYKKKRDSSQPDLFGRSGKRD